MLDEVVVIGYGIIFICKMVFVVIVVKGEKLQDLLFNSVVVLLVGCVIGVIV